MARNRRFPPFHSLFLALTLVATGAATAAADELGDRREGRDFAMAICSECHWVSEKQIVIPENEAPSFFQVADDPAITATALRVFFGTPHQNMPDIMLSNEERDNVIAYILSLRKQ